MVKVFISVGMTGRREDDVRDDIDRAQKVLKKMYKDVPFLMIHNYDCKPSDDIEVSGLWYLGQAIEEMGKCNVIFFVKGYDQYNGCLVEEFVAKKYRMPIVYEELSAENSVTTISWLD